MIRTNYPNTFAGNADLTLETMSAEAINHKLIKDRLWFKDWIILDLVGLGIAVLVRRKLLVYGLEDVYMTFGKLLCHHYSKL